MMMVSMAGAMSTTEIGKIFSEIIRQDKVHIISLQVPILKKTL
jgi:deoxyhypusine synthase